MADLRLVKKELRRRILAQRDALPESAITVKSAAIRDAFMSLPELSAVRSVFIFVDFRSEVRTMPIVGALMASGIKVVVPYTDIPNKQLILCWLDDIAQLKPGSFGILEPDPASARRADILDIDCAVVPGSVFDAKGGRMGYGGGFYDRLLPRLRGGVPRIAIAFELQIVDEVPLGYYDQKIDIIVTEERVIRVSGHGR